MKKLRLLNLIIGIFFYHGLTNPANAAGGASPWVAADETNAYPPHVLTAVARSGDETHESSQEFLKALFKKNHKASILKEERGEVVGYGKILIETAVATPPHAVDIHFIGATEDFGGYTDARLPTRKTAGGSSRETDTELMTEEEVIESQRTDTVEDAIGAISKYLQDNLRLRDHMAALTTICGADNARRLVSNFGGDAARGFDLLLTAATPVVKAALSGGAALDVDAAKARARRTAESAAGITMRESVIGEDQRVRVTNPKLYPWHAQGKLYMTYKTILGTKGFIGSGTLVGPRHVLTAGHCAYDSTMGWPSAIEFVPGKAGHEAPFGKYNVAKILAPKQWVSSEKDSWDMALLVLERNVDESLGFMGLIALPDPRLKGHTVNIAGFPGDRDRGEIMYTMGEALTDIAPEELGYTIDTAGGQSGSGVWSKWRKEAAAAGVGAAATGGAGEFLEGYHCAGVHVRGSNKGNEATRITSEKLNLLVSWMKGH